MPQRGRQQPLAAPHQAKRLQRRNFAGLPPQQQRIERLDPIGGGPFISRQTGRLARARAATDAQNGSCRRRTAPSRRSANPRTDVPQDSARQLRVSHCVYGIDASGNRAASAAARRIVVTAADQRRPCRRRTRGSLRSIPRPPGPSPRIPSAARFGSRCRAARGARARSRPRASMTISASAAHSDLLVTRSSQRCECPAF